MRWSLLPLCPRRPSMPGLSSPTCSLLWWLQEWRLRRCSVCYHQQPRAVKTYSWWKYWWMGDDSKVFSFVHLEITDVSLYVLQKNQLFQTIILLLLTYELKLHNVFRMQCMSKNANQVVSYMYFYDFWTFKTLTIILKCHYCYPEDSFLFFIKLLLNNKMK